MAEIKVKEGGLYFF